jgi:hypothetical protein
MLSKEEIEKAGYTVLPEGGWLRIMPEDFPHDWELVAKKLKFDPNATEIILCVAGVKEVA